MYNKRDPITDSEVLLAPNKRYRTAVVVLGIIKKLYYIIFV
jgi:hypothetical protein